jgi:hypothetical protein
VVVAVVVVVATVVVVGVVVEVGVVVVVPAAVVVDEVVAQRFAFEFGLQGCELPASAIEAPAPSAKRRNAAAMRVTCWRLNTPPLSVGRSDR